MSRKFALLQAAGFSPLGDGLTSMYVPCRLDVVYDGMDENGEVLPSMTRQEFAEECDLNQIMKRYEKTGMLPVNAQSEPRYIDFTQSPADLQEAMRVMIEAEAAFMSLPASVRRDFDNDAMRFVEFAEDGANLGKLREWGLAPPEKAPEPPMRVEVVNPPTPPSEVPSGEAAKG